MDLWCSKRRGRLCVMAEILEIAENEALKTHFLYRANLNLTRVNDFLRLMLEINLLKKVKQNDRTIYRATRKGLDFLQRYRDLAELLKIEEENSKINGKIMPLHLLKNVKSVVYVSKTL